MDVQVLKTKKGVPTKLYIDGHVYALVHDNQFSGKKVKK